MTTSGVLLEWGNVAEWVGGTGTVGALAFAAYTLRTELRARREDLERARQAQARRIQLKAELTASGRRLSGALDDSGQNTETQFATVMVTVKNHSDAGIYDVWAEVRLWWFNERVTASGNLEERCLGPLETGLVECDASIPLDSITVGIGVQTYAVGFTDAAGLRWEKSGDGSLRPSVDDF